MQKLTTVIPVYNGERFLLPTLDAVARQTRPADRVVVLDNGSTDRTPEIVRTFPLNIEFVRNDTNLGVLGNINKAFSYARATDYLHILTADDLVAPTFFEKLLAALSKCKGPAIGYVHNEEINAEGEVIGPLTRRPSGPPRMVPLTEFLSRHATLDCVLLPGVIFKTDHQDPVAVLEDFPQVGDSLLYSDWAKRTGQVIEVPEYLCQYRFSPFNQTSKNVRDLKRWVLDEWAVMERVANLIDEPPLARRRRREMLKLRFCARSCMKVQMMQPHSPDYAKQIREAAIRLTSLPHWTLGKSAVLARRAILALRGERWKVGESIDTTAK
ncbi:MAG TPA: glycosyltransferase family 2 protein [Methylomirabilota bacterium]|nr:glycosyltransferase family 2 protein [Methylomirabilota bacterium]